ncbi:baseplate J/gp47 family protein [Vibrio sp. Vb2853]|uniref:baseplate assembly protein n=1 Tax=unclassified Vibrio TaxID=2614977 RepID=UPI0029646923|nr:MULTISPECIES: baseplate J/gp47 family protein [unclassified Vibrio]MDW1616825.1 baseplate J/gp47 family protein [Vibrio sp. Vb2881]MDW1621537.1 baseplate J/gp47 family protein [Vibrio sp. Vb2864]MDW1693652.1 baseplate J/gp47 family protein [Vibrio sp. Vb2853]MDW1712361.1 baseplate J/gp47 family protein [Vibrio sp. Vb2865]MDW1717482.1 baseplate J/gp47 family protein [Vibrio sp. Vb2873]
MATVNVDIPKLPKPAVIEELDYEQILLEWIERYKALDPDYQDVNESDPVYKLIEVAAFREMVLRQRVNDGAHATMLAYAVDEDLDVIGANFDVQRLVIDEGDPNAVPPRERIMESNEAFRYRIQLSNRAKNTAGSADDYEFWALSADGRVKSIATDSPKGTLTVTVSVLSHDGNGAASAELIKSVEDTLTPKGTRPLSDEVVVQSAKINEFAVVAELELFSGPSQSEVLKTAREQLDKWLSDSHRQGMDLTLDGFYASLRVPGVYKVHLTSPAADIINDQFSAGYANSITLTARVTV